MIKNHDVIIKLEAQMPLTLNTIYFTLIIQKAHGTYDHVPRHSTVLYGGRNQSTQRPAAHSLFELI